MTEFSRPWAGTTIGDAGPYSSDNWSQLERYIIGNDAANVESGPITGSGIIPDPGLTVTQRGAGANMSVDVSLGAALVNGTFYFNDATKNLSITANASGNPRIDTVVLNKDWSAQTIRLVVVVGTPAGSPTPPSLVQNAGVQWQIPLADIAVANGAITITTANIQVRKSPANVSDGIYLHGILNNSGVVLQQGDVVIWDSTADRAITTTTTANDPKTAGVIVGRVAIGAYCRILIRGIGYVNSSAAVASRGLYFRTHTVAKQATPASAGVQALNNLGFSLQITAGAGLCLAYIDVNHNMQGALSIVANLPLIVYSTTSATFGVVSTSSARVTIITTSGRVKITFIFTGGNTSGTGNDQYDILLDGATLAGGAAGLAANPVSTSIRNMTVSWIYTGLSIGQHTFDLVFRNNVAGQTTQIPANVEPIVCMGEELS